MNSPKRVIVWRVTQNCNMSCLFCSYSNDVHRKRDTANEDDVSRLLNILGDYKRERKQDILISWIGGEPFLWKPIMAYSKAMKEDYGIDISTTTNGLLLASKQLRSDVLDCFSEIVFSLDGFRESNDRIRKLDGHFDIVRNAINCLSNEKIRSNSNLGIKVNTILTRENIGQFEEFSQMLLEIGVDEVTFNQLGGFDRPEFYPQNRLQDNQVKEFIQAYPELRDKYSKLGLRISGSAEYLNRILFSTEDKTIAVDECNPGKWFWFINENGYISPCSYTSYEYKLHINTIKTYEDIENTQDYFSELRMTNRSRWCDDCHCTQFYDKFK